MSVPGSEALTSTSVWVPAGRGLQSFLITTAVTAGSYSQAAIGPLQETMRTALSFSDNQVALLQGPALAVPVLALAVPLGLYVDRYSRARFLVIFAVLNLIGSLLTAFAPNFETLFAIRCVVGLTAPATWIAGLSLLADLYAPNERGRANMMVVLGQCFGGSGAFALGGTLLTMSDAGPNSWRNAAFWLAVPLLPIVFMMLAMREPPRTEQVIQNPSTRESFAELWRCKRVILPLFIGLATMGITQGAAVTWVAPTFSRDFALSPARIGAVVAVVLLVSGILGPIVGGVIADLCQRTRGPRRTVLVLTALTFLSTPAAIYAVAPEIVSASALFLLFMTAMSITIVVGQTVFTIVVPNELRGLSTSLLGATCMLVGLGLAPLTVSLLSDVIGGPAMIGQSLALVCVAASLAAAVAFAFGIRYLPHAPAPCHT